MLVEPERAGHLANHKRQNLGLHPDRGRVLDRSTHCQLWQEFWSVKFYPYNEPGVDPVFAVVGADRVSFHPVFAHSGDSQKQVLICRPPPPGQVKIEFIRVLLDDEACRLLQVIGVSADMVLA